MNKTCLRILTLISTILLIGTSHALSQGSLTPSGPPSPSGVSLAQIGQAVIQRTSIVYAGYYINSPGSYCVATNLTGYSGGYGIQIASDNVTLDLNGFTLQGVSGSFSGIYISGNHTNITIRNGIVTSWGANGVSFNYGTAVAQNVVVDDMIVTGNANHGIAIGTSCSVTRCKIQNNKWLGIAAFGDESRVSHNSIIDNNTGNHSGSSGIQVQGSKNLIEDNYVSGSMGNNGIVIFNGTGNIVMKNIVNGWGSSDYVIPIFNDGGPVGTAASSTSVTANIGL